MKILPYPICVLDGAGDISLHTHDRGDVCLASLLEKINRTKHVAVVSDRHLAHPQFTDALHQVLDPNRTVQERVLSVQMKMGEIARSQNGHLLPFQGLADEAGWRSANFFWKDIMKA